MIVDDLCGFDNAKHEKENEQKKTCIAFVKLANYRFMKNMSY